MEQRRLVFGCLKNRLVSNFFKKMVFCQNVKIEEKLRNIGFFIFLQEEPLKHLTNSFGFCL